MHQILQEMPRQYEVFTLKPNNHARLTEPDKEQLFCDPRELVTARDYIELGQRWAAENAAGLETSAAFQLMQAFIFYMPCEQKANAL